MGSKSQKTSESEHLASYTVCIVPVFHYFIGHMVHAILHMGSCVLKSSIKGITCYVTSGCLYDFTIL